MASGVTQSQVILWSKANTIIPLSFHPFISEIGTLTPCCCVEDLSSLPGLFQFQNRKSHLPGTVLSKLGMVGSAGDGHLPPKKWATRYSPGSTGFPDSPTMFCAARGQRGQIPTLMSALTFPPSWSFRCAENTDWLCLSQGEDALSLPPEGPQANSIPSLFASRKWA